MIKINEKVRDGKVQYHINREAGKISALSTSKVNEYGYLTSEEILSSDQSRITEQAIFTYSPTGETFKKQ